MSHVPPHRAERLENATLNQVWELASLTKDKVRRGVDEFRHHFHHVLYGEPGLRRPVASDGDREASWTDVSADAAELAAFAGAAEILALHEDIRRNAARHASERNGMLRDLGKLESATPNADPAHRRADLLLRLAARLVREHGANPAEEKRLKKALGILRDMLWHENENIQVTADVLRSIPREEWSDLQTEKLKTVQILEPVRWKDLPNDELRHGISLLTMSSFPGSDADFKEFTNDENAYVCAAYSGKEIIAAVSAKMLPGDILHFDWLCMNQRSDLRGLGEALIRRAVQSMKQELRPKASYGIAKAHMRSLAISIEGGGGTVGYGLTTEGGQTFVEMRDTEDEQEAYVGKKLSAKDVQELVANLPANTLQDVVIGGKECKAARVMFLPTPDMANPIRTNKEELANVWPRLDRADLRKTPVKDPRQDMGAIYDWIEQGRGERVLTRYVPLYASPETYGGVVQVYGAIFEKNALDPEKRAEFERRIAPVKHENS